MNNSHFLYPKFSWARSFITQVTPMSYHASRNFSLPHRTYTMFVGRSFWRLVLFVYASAAAEDHDERQSRPVGNEDDAPAAWQTLLAPFTSLHMADGDFALADESIPEDVERLLQTEAKSRQGGLFDEWTEEERAERAADCVEEDGGGAMKESAEATATELVLPQYAPTNALITGVRGCGKSHLLTIAAAFLTARNTSDLYRVVSISDCRAWMQSENPVTFFTLELLAAFHRPGTEVLRLVPSDSMATANVDVLHEANPYAPPVLFSSFERLRRWMEAVGRRLAVHADMRLVIFVDQLEELYVPTAPPKAKLAAQIFELLVQLRFPVLIATVIPSPQAMRGLPPVVRDPTRFAEMKMPAILSCDDFDLFLELFAMNGEGGGDAVDQDMLLHDLRMWTGGIPGQIAKFFASTGEMWEDTNDRIMNYRRSRYMAFYDLLATTVGKLEKLPRMHLLLQICRMILHMPTNDPHLSASAASAGLESLFLPAALQKFYHLDEVFVVYRHIPTAITPAVHYALADTKLLAMISSKWSQVLEALLAATLNSPDICEESKRRTVRFYAQFRLFSAAFDEEMDRPEAVPISIDGVSRARGASPVEFVLRGITQYNHPFSLTLVSGKIRRVIFAGLSPVPSLIPPGRNGSSHAGDPILFIPGRTDYCFYDFFVAVPAERTLYAISTLHFAPDDSILTSTFNTATNAPLTPFTLLEMWCKDLKDAGYPRFTAKFCFINSRELLTQLHSPYMPRREETRPAQ